MTRRIAEAVAAAGGRTYYVGGCVRDWLLGREVKDIDIEVHGVSVPALEGILDGLGERTAMGESFGVMGLRHYDIDIAMPRSEVAVGRGHRDFAVFVDPFIGPERAARRRDFTINAMMRDALTGDLLDFFGGREDLARRRIRHVNDATFAEDPLRVFRAAQFAARFGFDLAEETAALAAGMDATALPPERVLGELDKALLKAPRPSAFFRELRRMRQLAPWFAELAALPGDAWTRAAATLDGAAGLRASARLPGGFMLAALCLELDRPEAAAALLDRLTREARRVRYALDMCARHRELEQKLAEGAEEADWMALFDASACPEDLLLLERAVARGRGAEADWTDADRRLRALLALYARRMEAPCVMGRDLVAAGVSPGPAMGEALAYAHGLRLIGVEKREQLDRTLRHIRGDGADQTGGGLPADSPGKGRDG